MLFCPILVLFFLELHKLHNLTFYSFIGAGGRRDTLGQRQRALFSWCTKSQKHHSHGGPTSPPSHRGDTGDSQQWICMGGLRKYQSLTDLHASLPSHWPEAWTGTYLHCGRQQSCALKVDIFSIT